jgi:putative ABC transport system substrate-binding protein
MPGVNRRTLVLALAAVLAGPSPSRAQAPARVHRIGFLSSTTAAGYAGRVAAFRNGLSELGWTEGKNIAFEFRWADGANDRLPALAADLARANPDLIATIGTPATRAAQRATSTIAIVMISVADPVGSGIVANLAQPGGNITGVTNFVGDTTRKLLETLIVAIPKLARVAVLMNPTNPSTSGVLKGVDEAARNLGVSLATVSARTPAEVDQAFALMKSERAQAFFTLADPFLFDRRVQIAELAAQARIPAIYNSPEYVDAGGLMSYGVNTTEVHRLAAAQVDRVLRGTPPGRIPVEQPTQLELVVSLRAARALGITIPQAILVRADRIIE